MADEQNKRGKGTPQKPQQNQPEEKPSPPSPPPIERISDPTFLMRILPDVSNLLAPRPNISDVIKDSIFIFDASSLLLPYSLTAQAFVQFETKLKAFGKLGKLRMAEHALREFAYNRAKQIAGILQRLSIQDQRVSDDFWVSMPVIDSPAYQKVKSLSAAAAKAVREYKIGLWELQAEIANWNHNNDPVTKLYSEVFPPESVIKLPVTPEKAAEQMKERNETGVPPGGGKDAEKRRNAIGDYAVWLSVIEAGKQGNVVLVSNDLKEDWMTKLDDRPYFPRIELLEEFHDKTKHHFTTQTLEQFYTLIEAEEAAGEVRNIAAHLKGTSKLSATLVDGANAQASLSKPVHSALSILSAYCIPALNATRRNPFGSAKHSLEGVDTAAKAFEHLVRMGEATTNDEVVADAITELANLSVQLQTVCSAAKYHASNLSGLETAMLDGLLSTMIDKLGLIRAKTEA